MYKSESQEKRNKKNILFNKADILLSIHINGGGIGIFLRKWLSQLQGRAGGYMHDNGCTKAEIGDAAGNIDSGISGMAKSGQSGTSLIVPHGVIVGCRQPSAEGSGSITNEGAQRVAFGWLHNIFGRKH